MRKYKQVRKRFNNKHLGISVLIVSLIVAGGISRTKNVVADEPITTYNILATESVYIANRNTTNIIPMVARTEPSVSQRPQYNINLSETNQNLIYELCAKNNLSYEFVLSVFHYESKFNPKSINKNTDGSRDEGICQLNSYYTDTYREYAIKYCGMDKNTQFDPFNADHSIRAGIGTLAYLKNFWIQKGVDSNELLEYITGSYNQGIVGYQSYIKRTGKTEREYSKQIQARKEKLRVSRGL